MQLFITTPAGINTHNFFIHLTDNGIMVHQYAITFVDWFTLYKHKALLQEPNSFKWHLSIQIFLECYNEGLLSDIFDIVIDNLGL